MVREKHPPDVSLLVVTALLVAAGILFIYDASFVRASQTKFLGNDPQYFLKRQVMWAVVGAVLMAAAAMIPYWKLERMAGVVMALALISLAAVFVIGHYSHGATRWLRLGPIRVQPSEIAKVALVLFMAREIAAHPRWVRHLTHGFLPLCGVILIVCGLVAVQPDLGTALVVAGTGGMMLFLGGARKRHLALLTAAGILAVILFIAIEPYRMERVLVWRNPEHDVRGSGYQVVHSLIALGSGGAFGVGLGQGRQKYFYLPAEHTDYILGTIGEEVGFAGTMTVLLLFLYLAWRGFTIAHRTQDPFGSLVAGGLASLVAIQAILNIGVVTKTFPPTGVPLPFLSYGGSSLVVTMVAIGLLVNIGRYPVPPRGAERTGWGRDEAVVDRGRNRRAHLSGHRDR